MLQIDGLRRPGLRAERFGVEASECLPVMGPSGAGKSLLLRAIADLDPNEGEVRLNGAPRSAMPAPDWRRQVVYVAAGSGWWADTVTEHFADIDAARPILAPMQLPEDCLNWPVSRLSTGERQRLALARALCLRPPVLLLDEPTAALDEDAVVAVERLLLQEMDLGRAILLVTHDAAQARRLAKRMLFVADGAVEERPT